MTAEPHVHAPREQPRITAAAYDRAAALFRAAGDPQRLRLLARLAEGEECVTALADAGGDELPAVSQRLRVLRTEGLVDRRRDGRHVYYRLADTHVADLIRNALVHAAEPHHPGVSGGSGPPVDPGVSGGSGPPVDPGVSGGSGPPVTPAT